MFSQSGFSKALIKDDLRLSNERTTMPNIRVKISLALRSAVWNKYIGERYGIADCYTGCGTTISQATFQCGHVIPASKGGPTDVNNLRPICQRCNTSMGTENLFDFMTKCGFTVPNQKVEAFPNIKRLMREFGKME